MKIVRLHYFDTYEIFQGHRRFTKLGFEAEIDTDHETLRDCFYDLKRKSEELFYESKAAAEKQMGTQVRDISNEDIILNKDIDERFDELKTELSKIEFKEDAEAYLSTTDFRLTLAAKNIVNSKPLKNEHK